MFNEFKKFAIKGNVIDMAVGIVIGTAFGKIVNSLVSDIIMPPIGIITGGVDFSNLSVTLKNATATTEKVSINYGMFINTILDFLIIAFAMFLLIRQMNKMKRKEEEKKPATPEEITLLREIRDSLKSKKQKTEQ